MRNNFKNAVYHLTLYFILIFNCYCLVIKIYVAVETFFYSWAMCRISCTKKNCNERHLSTNGLQMMPTAHHFDPTGREKSNWSIDHLHHLHSWCSPPSFPPLHNFFKLCKTQKLHLSQFAEKLVKTTTDQELRSDAPGFSPEWIVIERTERESFVMEIPTQSLCKKMLQIALT